MKITLENTPEVGWIGVGLSHVPARIWTGTTESGIQVLAFITRIGVPEGCDPTELERELTQPPTTVLEEDRAVSATALRLAQFHELPVGSVTPRHVILAVHATPAAPRSSRLITAVLLSGGTADYAVYVGEGDALWVSDYGTKIHFEVAELLFPGIEERRYRA